MREAAVESGCHPHYDVFVSYASDDNKKVDDVVGRLISAGMTVAWDKGLGLRGPNAPKSTSGAKKRWWHHFVLHAETPSVDSPESQRIVSRLTLALQCSSSVLILWGRSSRASVWCSWEVDQANERRLPLIVAALDETPIDPFTIDAIEAPLASVEEVVRDALHRAASADELPVPKLEIEPELQARVSDSAARKWALWDLMSHPRQWWATVGWADGNLPLLAPPHLVRGSPIRGMTTATLLQAVGTLMALMVAGFWVGVPKHVLGLVLATVVLAGSIFATTVGFGAGGAGAIYGATLALLVEVPWMSLAESKDQAERAGPSGVACAIGLAFGVAAWRTHLVSWKQSRLRASWKHLLTGTAWGLAGSALLLSCAVLLAPPQILRPVFRALGRPSNDPWSVRTFFVLLVLLVPILVAYAATMNLLNRARDRTTGALIRQCSMVLVALGVLAFASVVGPATSRTFSKYLPMGALAGALVGAAYFLPSARLGPETPADQSTALGIGSVMGLLPGVWTAFFVFENTKIQAWYVLQWSLAVIAVGWIPPLLIPSGRGRRLFLSFLGIGRARQDA